MQSSPRKCHLQSSCLLGRLDPFSTNYSQGIKRKFDKSTRSFKIGDYVFFKSFEAGKKNWQEAKKIQRLASIMYIVEGGRFQHRSHINQLTSRYAQNKKPVPFNLPIEIFNNVSEVTIPKTNMKIQRY